MKKEISNKLYFCRKQLLLESSTKLCLRKEHALSGMLLVFCFLKKTQVY